MLYCGRFEDRYKHPEKNTCYFSNTIYKNNDVYQLLFTDYDLFNDNYYNQYSFIHHIYLSLNKIKNNQVIVNSNYMNSNSNLNNYISTMESVRISKKIYNVVLSQKSNLINFNNKKNSKLYFLNQNLITKNFSDLFKIQYQLEPVKFAYQSINSHIIFMRLKILIKKDLFKRILSGQESINLMWILNLMLYKNINLGEVNESTYNVIIDYINLIPSLRTFIENRKFSKITNNLSILNPIQLRNYFNGISNTSKKNSKTKLNNFITSNLKAMVNFMPFNYQMNNIEWMSGIEKKILQGKTTFDYLGSVDFFSINFNKKYSFLKNNDYICKFENFFDNLLLYKDPVLNIANPIEFKNLLFNSQRYSMLRNIPIKFQKQNSISNYKRFNS